MVREEAIERMYEMPLNCPKCFAEYDACGDCHFLWEGRCDAYSPSMPIDEILTNREAIKLLQDRPTRTVVQTRIVMSLDAKAMELQNRIVALENKLHSDKKSKYTIQ